MTQSVPRIDVALATYDGGAYLNPLLQSLAQQSHGNIEIILSDDGSSDDTLAIASAFAGNLDIRLVGDGVHRGVVGNFGAALSGGSADYVALCDQDDVWHQQKLAQLFARMKTMEAEHGAAMPLAVFSDLRIVDAQLAVVHPSFYRATLKSSAANRFEHFVLGNHVPGCALLVNRRLLDLALPFPEVPVHDWWLLQIASLFGQIGFVDAALVDYRQHAGNVVGLGQGDAPGSALMGRRARWDRQAADIRANLLALQARFATRLPVAEAMLIARTLHGGIGNTAALRRSGERLWDRLGIGASLAAASRR